MRTLGRIQLCPCGKRCYATAWEAHRALERWRALPAREHRKGRKPRAVYHCEHGFFHLTSMAPSRYAERVLEEVSAGV